MNKIGKFRWVICALLFAACVINYMDRQILGLLWGEGEFKRVVGWSDRDYGLIAICFQASYALGQVAFGPIIDFLGTRKTYALAMVFWSCAAMSHALARSFGGWGLARFALGAGESGNFPAAIKTVTEWFPPKERSVATGLFNSGSNIGAMVAPLLVPFLFHTVGWRGAFITLGLAGFVWLAFWLWLYQPPEKSPRVSAAELAHLRTGLAETAEEKIPWTKLLGYREAWAYYGTCVLVGPVWWFYGFWLPGFFQPERLRPASGAGRHRDRPRQRRRRGALRLVPETRLADQSRPQNRDLPLRPRHAAGDSDPAPPQPLAGGGAVCARGRGPSGLVRHYVFRRGGYFSQARSPVGGRLWRDAGRRCLHGVFLVRQQRDLAPQGGHARVPPQLQHLRHHHAVLRLRVSRGLADFSRRRAAHPAGTGKIMWR